MASYLKGGRERGKLLVEFVRKFCTTNPVPTIKIKYCLRIFNLYYEIIIQSEIYPLRLFICNT